MNAEPPAASHDPRTDHDLLLDYVKGGCGGSFAELTRRYAGLVYHAALRRAGEVGLAEEVTQSTFALLARKAESLTTHPCLSGWLHRTATWLAGDAQARESSHRRRMKSYAESIALQAAGDDPLVDALPYLDEALESLRESDRRLILLRFHDRLSFQAIGDRLQQPHDTVRKATQRAVEKLGAALRRSGITLSRAILAGSLTSVLTPSAPSALLAKLPAASLAAAGSMSWKMLILNTLYTMNAAKQIAAAAALVAFFAVPTLAVQELQQRKLRAIAEASRNFREQTAVMEDGMVGKAAAGVPVNTVVSSVDVLAMLREVPSAKDPFRTAALAAEALGTVDPALIASCHEAVKSIRNEMLALCLNVALFKRWTEVEPEAAMLAAQASKKGDFAVAVGVVSKTWMQRDPREAIVWLKAASEKEQERVFSEAVETTRSLDSAVLAQIIGGWSAARQKIWAEFGMGVPVKSMEIALHLPPGEIREKLIRSGSFSAGDPVPALDWCLTHLQGNERFQALTNLVFGWSRSDPERALEWYLRQPPGTAMAASLSNSEKLEDDGYYAEFRQRFPESDRASLDLHRVMMMDGQKAAGRIGSLPEGNDRTQLYATVARNWVDKAPNEASVWIDSLPIGPERDSAASGLIQVIQRTDVFSAMTWAESIRGEKLRNQTIIGIWQGWRGRDGVAAGKWLREGDISPASRAVIETENASREK